MTNNPAPTSLRRRLAVAAASLAAVVTFVAGTATPSAAMAPAQNDIDGVVWLLGGRSTGAIDELWARSFATWGRSYVSPSIYFYNSPTVGDYDVAGCGSTVPNRYNGFYCSYTQSIYLDWADQNDRMQPGGRYTFGPGEGAGFLAHEFGHHVQHQLGYPAGSIRAEYHADCLAGIYMRYGYAAGRLTGGDYWGFHNWLLSTPVSDSHGNPYHRTLWYRYGWDRYDINACNLAYR